MQLLVREPYGVVQSFSKGLQPTLLELGYGVSVRSWVCMHDQLQPCTLTLHEHKRSIA